MYYLLKLEVNQKIPKGATVISRYKIQEFGKPFVPFNPNEIEHNFSGTLWNGEEVFGSISEKYEIGGTIKQDIYDIVASTMAIGDARDGVYGSLSDEVYDSLKDLLEDDLMEQWGNLDDPIVFLMEINSVSTWTVWGDDWDVENGSVKVITQDDLKRLAG